MTKIKELNFKEFLDVFDEISKDFVLNYQIGTAHLETRVEIKL